MNAKIRTGWTRALVLPLLLATAACDDDDGMMGPDLEPEISVSAQTLTFATVDILAGSGETLPVTVRNDGDEALTVTGTSITGGAAADFAVTSGGAPFTLAPGASNDVLVRFDPMASGSRGATLELTSDDPDMASVSVALAATVTAATFTQVDRMGIPGLNTVFNHPSGIAGFDKRQYNVRSPDTDLANYTAQFETVLGAVGNADPAATAALLLPDALPVSLGAGVTAFAQLTGRELADDAVDVALFVTVGVASLQSDNVDANDVPFLNAFPYLAEAN